MQAVMRRICQLTLAVVLAAGMAIGLGACNNRQEIPANTQNGQTTTAPTNSTTQEEPASSSPQEGSPSTPSVSQSVSTDNDEQHVRDAVTKMLNAIKSLNRESLEPYMSNLDSSTKAELDAYGIDMYGYVEHLFKRFDYKIDDVQIDGDNATVKLTITNANLVQAIISSSERLQQLDEGTIQQLSTAGEKAIMQKYMELFYASIDEEENLISTPSELKLVKSGGVWRVDENSAQGFSKSIYGNVSLPSGGETTR